MKSVAHLIISALLLLLPGCGAAQPLPTTVVQREAPPTLATSTRVPTASPPASTATAASSPTASPPRPPHVGVQVGHWQAAELPAELERFRTSTGAFAAGVSEVEVNLPVAERIVALLEASGVTAELLPATVPVGYLADAFVSIHADGSPAATTRGFKMANPWRASPAAQALLAALEQEYAAGTQFPQDGAITFNMRGYYAFSWRRHQHAIAPQTPAVIVEMGFLTNPTDRAVMLANPDLLAASIAAGILRYLDERDPADLAALNPPDFATQRVVTSGVTLHALPQADAAVLATLSQDARFLPFREQNGWFEGVIRDNWQLVGWVRREDLVATSEPFPTPEAPPSR